MCQKLRQNDKTGINGKFNENKARMTVFFFNLKKKTCRRAGKTAVGAGL